MTVNTGEVIGLRATPLTGAVRLGWGVSSTAYLASFQVVVEQNGRLVEKISVPATERELQVPCEGTGWTFNVEAMVAQGGKVITCNPLPPVVPPPTSSLEVGLIRLVGQYTGPPAEALIQQRVMEAQTGITRDRVDVRFGTTGEFTTGEELAHLEEWAKTGAKILPIYDPVGLKTRNPITIQSDMEVWAPVLKANGITVVECSNEPYYEGITAAEYAAVYKAMVSGLIGTGINVLAKGWGDYYTGTEWSQCAAGRGWCVDFAKALGGAPWAWAEHYYGAQDATGVLGGGNPDGWGSLPTMQAYRAEHDLTKPLYITETGFEVPAEGSEAEQARNLKERILQCAPASSGVQALYIFSAKGGEYGIYTSTFDPLPAVAAVKEAVATAG